MAKTRWKVLLRASRTTDLDPLQTEQARKHVVWTEHANQLNIIHSLKNKLGWSQQKRFNLIKRTTVVSQLWLFTFGNVILIIQILASQL